MKIFLPENTAQKVLNVCNSLGLMGGGCAFSIKSPNFFCAMEQNEIRDEIPLNHYDIKTQKEMVV